MTMAQSIMHRVCVCVRVCVCARVCVCVTEVDVLKLVMLLWRWRWGGTYGFTHRNLQRGYGLLFLHWKESVDTDYCNEALPRDSSAASTTNPPKKTSLCKGVNKYWLFGEFAACVVLINDP